MILFSKSWKSQSFTGSSTQLFSRYSSPRLSCQWQVDNFWLVDSTTSTLNSPWKPWCLPLCVGPCQRSDIRRLPRWTSPTCKSITLIEDSKEEETRLWCFCRFKSASPRKNDDKFTALHQSPFTPANSFQCVFNSKKWISSANPSVQRSLKGFWRSRSSRVKGRTWGEKITWGASSWWAKKLLMACGRKKSDVVGLPRHLLATAQFRKIAKGLLSIENPFLRACGQSFPKHYGTAI